MKPTTNQPVTIEAIRALIREENNLFEKRIDGKLETMNLEINDNVRQYRDETLTKMDSIVKELEIEREERELKNKQDQLLQEQCDSHEGRLKKLERTIHTT